MLQAPALKIKLKPRREPNAVSAATLNNESQSCSPTSHQNIIVANQHQTNSAHLNSDEDGKEGSLKRKNSSPTSSVSKRMCREDSDPSGESREVAPPSAGLPEVLSGRCEQVSAEPLVIKQHVGSQHASIAALIEREHQGRLLEDDDPRSSRARSCTVALENISHGQLQVISVVPSSFRGPRHALSNQDDMGAMDPVARASLDAAVSQQVYPFASWAKPDSHPLKGHKVALIPAHASWFAWDRIHKLERQALPQFFFGKSKLQSAEAFMQARNAVIMKYRSNPQTPLSVPDIREGSNLGDKELGQILDFLIQWGLVNYQAEITAETDGVKYPTKVPLYFTENVSGELAMTQLSLTSLEYLYFFDAPRAPAMALKSSAVDEEEPSSLVAESVVKEAGSTAMNGSLGSSCSACSGDCSRHHFYCEKQADYILCQDCYSNGNLGIGMTTADFTLSTGSYEGTDSFDNGSWSDQETLMLLEALEVHGDNWSEVSEFVGTKSKAQCISHFIGLPIEDRFFEDMEVPRAFRRIRPKHTDLRTQEGDTLQFIDLEAQLPIGLDKPEPTTESEYPDEAHDEPEMYVAFEGASNPVMSLVAFLAATVGPRVAAVAAHTALLSLSEEYKALRLAADCQEQNMLLHTMGPAETADGGIERERPETESSNHRVAEDHQPQLSAESVRKVTSAALAMAAMKTKLLADQEEREVQRHAAIIVDNQLKKLSTKLKQLGDVDSVLEKEREQMERNRQRILAERLRFLSSRLSAAGPVASQMPVVGNSGLINMRPTGAASPSPVIPSGGMMIPSGGLMPSGGVMSAAGVMPSGGVMPPGAVLPSHMLQPNLFGMGSGGMAVPVSAPMVKPPS